MPFAVAGITACALLLLVSEERGWRAGIWIFKPLASAGFVGVAVLAGGFRSPYGRLILLALFLSLAGDVLLIARSAVTFRIGLTSFLVAHLAFAAAFLLRGVEPSALKAAIPAGAFLGAALYAWLRPHLPENLRIPVAIYVVSIVAMASLACSTTSAAAMSGAVLFMASDVAVARNRFVSSGLINKVFGIPLYYAAQVLLALTASGTAVAR